MHPPIKKYLAHSFISNHGGGSLEYVSAASVVLAKFEFFSLLLNLFFSIQQTLLVMDVIEKRKTHVATGYMFLGMKFGMG